MPFDAKAEALKVWTRYGVANYADAYDAQEALMTALQTAYAEGFTRGREDGVAAGLRRAADVARDMAVSAPRKRQDSVTVLLACADAITRELASRREPNMVTAATCPTCFTAATTRRA